MKKIVVLMFAALFMTTSAFAFGSESIIRFDNLPNAAQQTIKKVFPKLEVAIVKKEEIPFLHTEYKVIFQNGINVEFDDTGEWKEIKGAVDGIPEILVPKKVADYVKDKYEDAKIIKIERKKDDGVEIKLSNKFKLTFNNIYAITDIERDDD